jgi:hypothetical protein
MIMQPGKDCNLRRFPEDGTPSGNCHPALHGAAAADT